MPFLDRLQHWAAVQPDATAVTVGADTLTYAELWAAASARLAATPHLSSVCLPNGTEFAVRFAAGVAGDRSCAVLDPGWPAAQRTDAARRLAAIAAGGADQTGLGTELRDGPPDRDFLYGFTSGTTSLPKAFTRSRRSWQLSFEHGAGFFGLTRHDRVLAPGPLSASLTLYALAESLHVGAAFVTLPRFDAGLAGVVLAGQGITRIVAAPTLLGLIGARALAAGTDGSGLTAVVSAGAKLDPGTVAVLRGWAPNATLYEYYGAAELSFVTASVLCPGEAVPASATAVGRALPGVDLRIRCADGRDAPPGAPGTIEVRSPLIATGYAWGDDGHAFRRDGEWCTVGDLGSLGADGVLHHLGRRADMIVTSGQNVYPQAVEAALRSVPGVETAVVTGLPDPVRGTRVVAAVIVTPETDAASLRSAAASLLAGPARPRAYYALPEAPVTGAGKLSRRRLREWIEDGDPRVRPLR
ncbi:MAG: AMP-binding protein, partial [Ramlibacter sp.]|nr:AMP-binding protein [Cryobacterium sp.]